MLADAAAALFGAGLGAPEHVRPFMETFLDEDENKCATSCSHTFKPVGRVLTRLSWPLVHPYIHKLLAAAQWKRYQDIPYHQRNTVKGAKLLNMCRYTTLILAPHVEKLLQVQECEKVEFLDEEKSASASASW